MPNFMCVLTNRKNKIYQTGFSFCRPGHAPVVGLGSVGGSKNVLAYQIEGDDEQNRIQVTYSP